MKQKKSAFKSHIGGKSSAFKISYNFTKNFSHLLIAAVGIALLAFLIWLIAGSGFGQSFKVFISVLLAALPVAISASVPLAFSTGKGVCAAYGIRADSRNIKTASEISDIIIEEHGIITEGSPKVKSILPKKCSEKELMVMASSIEASSDTPVARAIIAKSAEMGIAPMPNVDFRTIPGYGVCIKLGSGHIAAAGNINMIEKLGIATGKIFMDIMNMTKRGETPVIISIDDTLLGIIGVADSVREDISDTIHEIKKLGVNLHMVSENSKNIAEAVRAQADIERVFPEMSPDGVEAVVQNLAKSGKKVCVIGNAETLSDAMKAADLGISLHLRERHPAPNVIFASELGSTAKLISLSRTVMKTAKENKAFALIYSAISAILAACVLPRLSLAPVISLLIMLIGVVIIWLNSMIKCRIKSE